MNIERSGESGFLNYFDIEAALATENGPTHSRNEDRFVFMAPGSRIAEEGRQGYLFGVMDGCGGTAGGADASQICADRFRGLLHESTSASSSRSSLLAQGLMEANDEVVLGQKANEAIENMACAVTIAWLWEEEEDDEHLHATFAHAGDTRAYLVRGAETAQLTHDHEERSVLTQVVGMDPELFAFESLDLKLSSGDILLLATDGLWKPHGIDLVELIDSNNGRPDLIVKRWLEITRMNGSRDDQTAIAVLVS